jgi:hypothetical protein
MSTLKLKPNPQLSSPTYTIKTSNSYSSEITSILSSITSPYNSTQFETYPYFIPQPTTNFLPHLSVPSSILNTYQIKNLHNNLPYYDQFKHWTRLYCLSRDGTSIKTFYNKAQPGSSLLIVKDDLGNVFGAYSPEEYKCNPNKFYGTGETFLFSFYKTDSVRCFLTTGENDNYIYSDNNRISFGCSDDCFSLSIEDDFWKGYTATTKTFQNPLLTQNESFTVVNVELWTFQSI